MKKIDVFGIDNTLNERICIALDREMKIFGQETVLALPTEVMLCETLKILQTYPTIAMAPMTKVFLDSAKEYQVIAESYIHLLNNEDYDDAFIISPNSYMIKLLLYSRAQGKHISKMVVRRLIQKMAIKPSAAIYIRPDKSEFLKKRVGSTFSRTKRNEERFAGAGNNFKFKDTRYIRALGDTAEKFGTRTLIINVDEREERVVEVAKEIMKFLLSEVPVVESAQLNEK